MSSASRPTRRLALALGGTSVLAVLAACSSEGGSGSSDGGGGADVLARIQESGTVRIGL